MAFAGMTLMASPLRAQGFQTAPTNWNLPVGGYYTTGNVPWGYNAIAGSAAASNNSNSQTWSVIDIDGDGKSDLIVCAQNDANADDKVFSPASNPYWKVYLNNGSGFSTTATNWAIPVGGYYTTGNVTWGYNAIAGSATASNYNNSQTWNVMDMNGDNKPDLVISAQNDANADDKVFSPASSPYWKVYLNTGTGFSATATNWSIPVGGYYTTGNVTWGYNALSGSATASNYNNSQTWNTIDIDGDNKPDLVISAQNDANADDKTFSPTSNPYWKVYLNTGSGFSATATNWSIPVGGYYTVGNVSWGYNAIAGSAAASNYNNSQTWNLLDINGDSKTDLVISAQNDANADDKTFSPTSNPYWKVYMNTGSGFSSTVTNWTIPIGGFYSVGNVSWGFNAIGGTAAASNYKNSQTWNVLDIDGDSKVDLVVSAENDANADDKVFNLGGNPYWKVFLNSGTGFSAGSSNWPVPLGGYYTTGNVSWGFNAMAGNAASSSYVNNQTWLTTDLNGDKKPDMVVCAQNDASSNGKVFSPGSNPYWKVYINTGTVGLNKTGDLSAQDLIVFPNPSNGKFALMFSDPTVKTTIDVYNIMGEKVLESSGTQEIDLTAFPQGTYMALISDGVNTISKKLIVQ